jgi:tetratricopeptide (TPR) repeat protein
MNNQNSTRVEGSFEHARGFFSVKYLAIIILLVWLNSMAYVSSAWAAGFTETWYMYRGKSNMKIGNYKAAIEAFEKVVEKNPDNKEAMRSLGLAYEGQGLIDKAIEQFDRYLEEYPDDPEIAFKQAGLLEWSRYSYRHNDVLKYYRLGLAKKDDANMRLKYAIFLAKEKETSQEAITQFEKVLAREPDNAAAHRGAAKAYAWLGDNDHALHHSTLAIKYSKEAEDMSALRQNMRKGREPTLEGQLPFLIQPQKPFDLKGFRLGSTGKFDLTAFTTSTVEAGYEEYWNVSESASGSYVAFGTQYRINPSNSVDGKLGYHTLARTGGDVVLDIAYTHERGALSIRPGFQRELRYDSLMALAGSTTSGTLLGAARSNLFYTAFTYGSGFLQLHVTPFIGWVSTANLSPNEQLGIDLKTAISLLKSERWDLKAEYLLYLSHYGADHSGFQPSGVEPLPGGYFSPRIYINQIPRLSFTLQSKAQNEFYFSAGPAFQYIDEAATEGRFRIGGDLHASYTAQLPERFSLKLMVDFTQIANTYTRFQMNSFLVYRF